MAEFSLHCVGKHCKNIVGVVVFFLVGVICWLGKNIVGLFFLLDWFWLGKNIIWLVFLRLFAVFFWETWKW